MKYKVDNIVIQLILEKGWIRIKTDSGENIPLHNQTKGETIEIINKNYTIVKEHYQTRLRT